MDRALKDFIDYVDTTLPLYEDTELLYLSFRLLIKDKNEAINSLEFNTDMNNKTGYERVRVIGIEKHKVSPGETAINEEKKELDGTKNGILYCESIDKDKPKKGYYYLLGSSSPFKPGKLDSIIDTANDRSSELELEFLSSRRKIRRHSMGGGKRRNSKRKSKKNKTYKRKTYKRKNKRSKGISRKSRRSFIKKTRNKKSKGKRMVGGSSLGGRVEEEVGRLTRDIEAKETELREKEEELRICNTNLLSKEIELQRCRQASEVDSEGLGENPEPFTPVLETADTPVSETGVSAATQSDTDLRGTSENWPPDWVQPWE